MKRILIIILFIVAFCVQHIQLVEAQEKYLNLWQAVEEGIL